MCDEGRSGKYLIIDIERYSDRNAFLVVFMSSVQCHIFSSIGNSKTHDFIVASKQTAESKIACVQRL